MTAVNYIIFWWKMLRLCLTRKNITAVSDYPLITNSTGGERKSLSVLLLLKLELCCLFAFSSYGFLLLEN